MMTKKHFIALADYLRGLTVPPDVLDALCRFCRSQNGHFNESRFRGYLAGACGPSGGRIESDREEAAPVSLAEQLLGKAPALTARKSAKERTMQRREFA